MGRSRAESSAEIARRNSTTYSDPGVVRYYGDVSGLLPAERAILTRLAPELQGSAVLDLGVGGGRTVPFLTQVTATYLGLDYSPEMIAICRARYPDVAFRVGDARDLSELPDGAFDLIFFSFNGLDYVDHEDRLRVLNEVARLLDPNGRFVFSSHNLDAYRPASFPWTWNPAKLLIRLIRALPAEINRRGHRRLERRGRDYAMLVDSAHEHRLLTYYVRLPEQIRQLRAVGFCGEILAYGEDGSLVTLDHASPWIYYVAQLQ